MDKGRTRILLVSAVLATAMTALAGMASAAPKAPPPDPRPPFVALADEVTAALLDSAEYKARTTSRRPRIVVGNIDNDTDDESIRVEDIYNEIRNVLVATGNVRLFTEGELNADLIIAPQLTSVYGVTAKGRRQKCFTLQLTTTTIGGEYVTAHSASRCY